MIAAALFQAVAAAPGDFGPIYAETRMGRFPVEPWSVYSNLVFLLIVVYFARKTRFDYRVYPLITVSLPILLLGFLGGTIYHATRSHSAWLILDYMPIMILTMTGAAYFWRQLLGGAVLSLLALLIPLFAYRALTDYYCPPPFLQISLGYSTLALIVLAPVLTYYLSRRRAFGVWLLGAGAAFVVAIVCRQLDGRFAETFLPMGSHFLWHLFGGAGAFCLFQYVFLVEREIAREKKAEPEVS